MSRSATTWRPRSKRARRRCTRIRQAFQAHDGLASCHEIAEETGIFLSQVESFVRKHPRFHPLDENQPESLWQYRPAR